MLLRISLASGSPLIGSPIVFRVVPQNYTQQRTFYRIILRVYAGLDGDDDFTTFDFSTPVESKLTNNVYVVNPAVFDISSALRAVADKYEYQATPPTRYPYIKFRLEAWEEWMVDGEIYDRESTLFWPSASVTISGVLYNFFAYAFMGSWTDLERMNASTDQSGVEYLNLSNMSRKPVSSPEIVFKASDDSMKFVYPDEFNRGLETDHITGSGADRSFVSGAPTNGPKSIVYTPSATGAATVGGHSLYVIDEPANAYQLRFINGFGCMESLHVQSLVKREVAIQTDRHTVARQDTLKQFSRSVVRKTNDRETWSLTSGQLDEAWASWYVHEFLMAEQVWIGLTTAPSLGRVGEGLLLIPCHVVPEETTVLEDRTKAQPYEVQFKLQLDINGSPV